MEPADGPASSVLHVTSNGHGMGHLSRQAAIAISSSDPHEHVIASLSTAVPLLRGLGLDCEYIPGFDRGFIPRALFDNYLCDRLDALIDLTGSRVMVFDGVTPQQYPGVAMAALRHPKLASVWCRRGFWHRGFDQILQWERAFDAVLEPGDFVGAHDAGPTAGRPTLRVNPISMWDALRRAEGGLPSRAEAAARLGLDPDRPTVLVALGTGTLESAADAGSVVLSTLADLGGWQIAVTRPPIASGTGAVVDADITVLRGVFPLARYLAAFDMAVTAAGYNGVHELLPAQVPSLVIPNPVWSIDNQHARARCLAAEGLAETAHPADLGAIAAAVRHLADPGTRSRLAARLKSASDRGRLRVDGGEQAATLLDHLAEQHSSSGHPNAVNANHAAARMARRRSRILTMLGPATTSRAFSALGATAKRHAPPFAGPRHRLAVDPAEIATSAALPQDVAGAQPVEDLISDDETYRRRRKSLISQYYRVPPT